MRFKKIEFENYRCFINGILEFKENSEENINVIIGPNGGGKTEMLFAFWWVLYEFDFSRLRGKEYTPYALNSDLYKLLELGTVREEKKCSVVVEFEHLNIHYRLKKTVIFRKTEKQILQDVYQELSLYNDNGELSLPIRDKKEIDRQINKIIPKAILGGIIFDGERMQKLSSADEKSKKAIQGVINDITNVELIEKCISIYKDIRKELNSTIKKLAKQTRQESLEELVKQIGKNDIIIDNNSIAIKEKKECLDVMKIKMDDISEKLKLIEEVRALEIQRNNEKKNIEESTKRLDEYYKNFSASLKEAYLLNTSELMNTVEDIIQKVDIPVGLTVEAVRSILDRGRCICGNKLRDEEIEKLNTLIYSLPPDNINSTLSEVIRQTKDKIYDVKSHCKENYKYINECEKEIKSSKATITLLSSQILEFNKQGAKELEIENNKLIYDSQKLKLDIECLEKELESAQNEREDLIKQRDIISKNHEETNNLNIQLGFIEKCLNAFEIIKESNKKKALVDINKKIKLAYNSLSEDYNLGTTIYIVQYDEVRKYQMITYIKSKVNELLNHWKSNGKYMEYENLGLSESEIYEKAILVSADSNSTGQSKMNTLSFAKSILDYSNEQKERNGLEVQKEYPFLIDAPFSDIADNNLVNASKELHNFAKQVILMLDKDKYESIKIYISRYISRIYILEKNKEQNVTSIRREV